jgi:DNA repair protein RadA/Sms
MEGTRPLLVEVQALVAPTEVVPPRRVATGIDRNRLAMILAVLARHGGVQVGQADVFVNVAGGVRVDEPGADLGIALAVASSLRDVALPADLVAIGEVGLNGEVRAVSSLEARLKEAAKLGFRTAIVPAHNLGQVQLPKGLEVVGVSRLMEAIVKGLGAGVPQA